MSMFASQTGSGALVVPKGPNYLQNDKAALIERYRISGGDAPFLTERTVRLCLNGTTPISLLHQTQVLIPRLHNCPAISRDQLRTWMKTTDFVADSPLGREIYIGIVPEGISLSNSEQRGRGWNRDVSISELALAHQARLLMTGQDMFCGLGVRCDGGTLCYSPTEGLFQITTDSGEGSSTIGASVSISPI